MSKCAALILVGGGMMIAASFISAPVDKVCTYVIGNVWFFIGLFGPEK